MNDDDKHSHSNKSLESRVCVILWNETKFQSSHETIIVTLLYIIIDNHSLLLPWTCINDDTECSIHYQ